ncbi:MAG TPA: acyl-CoA dehydrogenase family protein, partial [Burkholderiaceae bacterium]
IALAAADANVAHVLRNHFTAVEFYLRHPVTARQRTLRAAVQDGALIGLAMAEQDSARIGAVGYRTLLTPDGDGFRLDGTKFYCTGTLFADYVLVRATAPADMVASVIIPTSRAGVEIIDDWDGTGQRLTGSGTTRLHAVRVEADEAILDSEDRGRGLHYRTPYNNTQAQLFITAVNAGILAAVLKDATALLRARERPFYFAPAERPGNDPLLQQTVGSIASDAFAARATVLAAAQALDEASHARDAGVGDTHLAHEAAAAAAKAKILVDELVQRAAARLFDVGGASSTRRSLNLDRHWRNARTLASHNPAAYKAQAIGNYEINGTFLPEKGFF